MIESIPGFGMALRVAAPVIVHVDRSPLRDWMIPFATGVAATLLGFGLTMLWDSRKARIDRRRRDATLLVLMHEEVATNIGVLQMNGDLLALELQSVDQGGTVVDALTEMQQGAWETIRGDLTRWLPDQTELFLRFRTTGISGVQFNQLVRNREQFRTQGVALPSYPKRMREFDEALIEKIALLQKPLHGLLEGLSELQEAMGIRPDSYGVRIGTKSKGTSQGPSGT